MAKIREFQCPKCNAPLAYAPDADTVTCRYCGSTSVVDSPADTKPHSGPVDDAPRPAPNTLRLTVSASIACIVVASVASRLSTGQAELADALGDPVTRFADHPMIADVNADGVLDVVGKGWTDSDNQFIAAFDGRDGSILWRTEPLTKDADDGSALRAVVHGCVLSIDRLGKAQAYDLVTGAPTWSALLGEQARRVCAGDGVIVVETADDTSHGLDPASGRKREISSGAACAAVFSSTNEETPGYSIIDSPEFRAHDLPGSHDTDGIWAQRALLPSGPGPRFLLGRRDKGTPVAKVAAVDGTLLWLDDVPGVDPLTTRGTGTPKAGFAAGRLVVPYDLSETGAGTRMACFEATSGKRLWDVQVHKANQGSSGMSVSDDSIFYATWSALYVLSLSTGELRYRIGTE